MVEIVAIVALIVSCVVAIAVLAFALIKDKLRDEMTLKLIDQALPLDDEHMKQKVMLLMAQAEGLPKPGRKRRASIADIKRNMDEAARQDDIDKKRKY